MNRPCEQCPWRLANQGTKHPLGFYTRANLRRLWNQLRGGGRPQSCHLTDPTHPDHVAAGAKPGARPKECPGSVIVIKRELLKMANGASVLTPSHVDVYLAANRNGLTKRGILYWAVERIACAGVPFFGGEPLPEVDVEDSSIGLPPLRPKKGGA